MAQKNFHRPSVINSIAVSTPHHPQVYNRVFYNLLRLLKSRFNQASVDVLLHSEAAWLDKNLLHDLDVQLIDISGHDTSALDRYADYDIHVGYRVHGHVSALSARIPSYLIATDGRGSGYGLTIGEDAVFQGWSCRGALSSFARMRTSVRNRLPKYTARRRPSQPSSYACQKVNFHVIDSIEADVADCFKRFSGTPERLDAVVAKVEQLFERID